VLIDRDARRADGHVQDLRDAEALSHMTRVVAGQFKDCCSADLTIITAGVSQSRQSSKLDNLREVAEILKGLVVDIAHHNPQGILLLASNPVDVLTYAAWKWSGLPSNRSSVPVRLSILRAFYGDLRDGLVSRLTMCMLMSWENMATAR
jgi:L-lactate dehydrogenase